MRARYCVRDRTVSQGQTGGGHTVTGPNRGGGCQLELQVEGRTVTDRHVPSPVNGTGIGCRSLRGNGMTASQACKHPSPRWHARGHYQAAFLRSHCHGHGDSRAAVSEAP